MTHKNAQNVWDLFQLAIKILCPTIHDLNFTPTQKYIKTKLHQKLITCPNHSGALTLILVKVNIF